MEQKKIAIIGITAIILIILCGLCLYAFTNNQKEAIEINDLNIEQDQFGIYNLVGHITPKKDFAYLEARIVFYDKDNTVIGKAPLAWNIRDASANEKLSLGNGMGGVCDETPAYAVVSFYDDVTSNTALINFTVRFNGNNTNNNTNDDSSNVVYVNKNTDNNKNDDKKYTQEDLDMARSDGYYNGYSDSYYDQVNYYEDDASYSSSSSSSNIETTSDDLD